MNVVCVRNYEKIGLVYQIIWMRRAIQLRIGKMEEPWTLVAGLPQKQLASERGVKDMLDIFDQKYGMDRQ